MYMDIRVYIHSVYTDVAYTVMTFIQMIKLIMICKI